MAVKVTQKEPHARVFVASKKMPDGRLVNSSLTLEPGVPKYVDDETWAAIKDGSHHLHPKTGKRTSTLDALVNDGHIEVQEGVSDPEAGPGSSKVTRGEVPNQHAVTLPGQGGEDYSRREDAEVPATEGEEETGEDGQRRRRRR